MSHIGTYMTPSLYDAIRYYREIEGKPKIDLLNYLNRVQTPKSEAMLAGIAFENDVDLYLKGIGDGFIGGTDGAYVSSVVKVSNYVKGSLFQQRISGSIKTPRGELFLKGVCDAIGKDRIYDIKFSKTYDFNKYYPSIQHLIYMYVTGIEKFSYLVSNGNEVFVEDYFWDDTSLELLTNRLNDVLDYIDQDEEIKTAYLNKWRI
jgi:hypothetical protein